MVRVFSDKKDEEFIKKKIHWFLDGDDMNKKKSEKEPNLIPPEELDKMIAMWEKAKIDDQKKVLHSIIIRLCEIETQLEQKNDHLDKRKTAVEGKEKSPMRIVLFTSLILGIICIISSILKTWFSTPLPFDWFLLGTGVILCGFSILKNFSLSASGLKAEIKEFKAMYQKIQNLKQH